MPMTGDTARTIGRGLRFQASPAKLCRPALPQRMPDRPVAGPKHRLPQGFFMGSLVKKRRKKMSKHKYRKRLRANRHKRKK